MFRLNHTCVHGQHFIVSEQAGDVLFVGAQHVVVEGPGRERESGGLSRQRGDDLRVAVTLVHGAVRAQEVKVAPPLHVPHVNPYKRTYSGQVKVISMQLFTMFQSSEGTLS